MQIKTSQDKLVNIYQVTTSADLLGLSIYQIKEKLCFKEKSVWEQIIKVDADRDFKTTL